MITGDQPPAVNLQRSTITTARRPQMDLEAKRFGRGPKELGGAVDLITQYKLWPEFFCKRSLPLSISETYYLRNVVGDTFIRKGEGMELGQLSQNNIHRRDKNAHIHPFDLDGLRVAFLIRETSPVKQPSAEKGMHTSVLKSKSELENKERKLRKHKDKDEDHKNRKHRQKDKSGDAVRNLNTAYDLKTDQLKEQQDMFIQKRRFNGFEDPSANGHKKDREQ